MAAWNDRRTPPGQLTPAGHRVPPPLPLYERYDRPEGMGAAKLVREERRRVKRGWPKTDRYGAC